MTTRQIQRCIGKMQVLKFHNPVIENFPFYKWEFDVLSVSKSQLVCEFEVKISRSDFLKPKEKTKIAVYTSKIVNGESELRPGYSVYVPNYFSYCCPPGLILPDEIPERIGLYYCRDNKVQEITAPKKLHSHKFDLTEQKDKILRYYSERTMLGSCRLTYDNKELKKLFEQRNRTHANS